MIIELHSMLSNLTFKVELCLENIHLGMVHFEVSIWLQSTYFKKMILSLTQYGFRMPIAIAAWNFSNYKIYFVQVMKLKTC